jgi:hypothetical protein
MQNRSRGHDVRPGEASFAPLRRAAPADIAHFFSMRQGATLPPVGLVSLADTAGIALLATSR